MVRKAAPENAPSQTFAMWTSYIGEGALVSMVYMLKIPTSVSGISSQVWDTLLPGNLGELLLVIGDLSY